MGAENKVSIDEIAAFCKKKGFVFPSGELYGGLAGFWDFGPLGTELVKNIKNRWWHYYVNSREDVVGIDGSIITNPKVWEASGHVENFVDVAVVCKKCGHRTKVDKHELKTARCDKCGGQYENKGEFNPMFTTSVGAVKDEAVKTYLRPETAQSIFVDFKLVQETSRMKLPFGIAQIGKAFRNEIAPREFLFRSREFEQMELEYFIKKGMKCPYMDEIGDVSILFYTKEMQSKEGEGRQMKIKEAAKKGIIGDWHAYWLAQSFSWFLSFGVEGKNFRARQHTDDERSHYAVDTWDLEYNFPMGWREVQGFANRGNYDLSAHGKHSKKSLEIFDDLLGEKLVPDVVCEPSLGVGRAFLIFLLEAYEYDKKRENTILHLHPKLAPYKAAVLPLVSKGEIFEIAREVYRELLEDFPILFDKSGSIGRRYARNDEIGTPYCVTFDEDSLKKKSVTIRDRDSTKQIRVKIDDLGKTLHDLVNDKVSFLEAGKEVETRVKE